MNNSQFEVMYKNVWVDKLMVKDAHFGYFRISELRFAKFREFITKFKFHFDILSVTYAKEKILEHGFFELIVSTDMFIDVDVDGSEKRRAFTYLKNTFVILSSKAYDNYPKKMPSVLNMDDVINIKRAVKDKRKALRFKFLTRINDYIVFEYESVIYTLHSKTLKLEAEKDMIIDESKYLLQTDMFEPDKEVVRDEDTEEKELYIFCKNFL